MAHELTIRSNGKVEMAYRGETPWHGLGQRLHDGADMETWLHAAGMNWEIQGSQVRYRNATGELQMWSDKQVLFRSDTSAPLGVVSDGYQVVQPREVMEFFRDLTHDAGMRMETAGTLFGGKRFWALARVTADLPILDLRDKVGGFLLLSTSADGSLSTEARWTTVRVVCNNTLSLSHRIGKPSVRVTHRSTFDADATKQSLGLRKGAAAFEDAMDLFRRLARTPLTSADMVRMTLKAFGHEPEKMGRKELEEAAGRRSVVAVGQLAIGGTAAGSHFDGASGTAWGWLNAVTQFVDHHAQARSANNRLDSAWFGRGDAMKGRALELAADRADASSDFISRVLAPVAG